MLPRLAYCVDPTWRSHMSGTSNPQIKPMGLGLSLAYFAIPASLFVIAFHYVMPALMGWQLTPFFAYFFAISVPLALLLAAALIAYKSEGNSWSWGSLKNRFRLHHLTGKMWFVAIGSTVVVIVLTGVLMSLNVQFLQSGLVPVPDLPAWLDSRNGIPSSDTMNQAFGGMSGNWLALVAFIFLILLNVVGEEFWWRGYVLPRQELAFGKWVWLVQGLMWAAFHVFKWWDLVGLLPLALMLPFLVCRYRNTSMGLVMHFLVNGLGIIPIALGVLATT
jgi:membrane protease YdiL (CAAX protease family)